MALQPDCFYRKGLVESFAYSLLSKSFPTKNAKDLYNSIVDIVSAAKESGGVITFDGLKDRLGLTDEECKRVADINIVALTEIQETGAEVGITDDPPIVSAKGRKLDSNKPNGECKFFHGFGDIFILLVLPDPCVAELNRHLD